MFGNYTSKFGKFISHFQTTNAHKCLANLANFSALFDLAEAKKFANFANHL